MKDADKIGVRVGKVINKRKVGKHFITASQTARLVGAIRKRSTQRRRWTGST